MSSDTLHDLIFENFPQNKDRQAIIFDNGQEKTTVAYQELLDMSIQISRVLRTFHRCTKEVVGLCINIDQYMPAILLGVVMSEAAFYNFDMEAAEFTCQVLHAMNIRIIIVTKEYYMMHKEIIGKLEGHVMSFAFPCLQQYVLIDLTSISNRHHHDNLAYCITTSGTTGTPKVVQVPYDCICPNIHHLRNIYGLTTDDLVLLSSPLTFDPCIVEMFTTLSVGACLLIVPPTVKMMPDVFLDVIHLRNSVSVMQVTPTLLLRFNQSRLSQTLLGDNSTLRVLSLGGEKFPSCTWLHNIRSSGNQTTFFNLYGTTEVSCWSTCYRVTDEDLQFGHEIPLGEPLQDTIIQVLSKSGEEITTGQGELYIGGTLRQCIVGNEKEHEYDSSTLKLRSTGDIVRKDGAGNLFYLGRDDLQVKRNGKRINLEEINQVAQQHASVRGCSTMLICPKLVTFIKSPPGNISIHQATKDIEEHLKDRLPAHCVPDDIVLVTNIPMTRHGKVDQDQLKSVYESRNMDISSLSASSLFERKWKEILGCKTEIQENANFISTGGNSLKAIHLQNDLENVLNIQVPNLLDRILHRTFSEVKTYLDEFENANVSPELDLKLGPGNVTEPSQDAKSKGKRRKEMESSDESVDISKKIAKTFETDSVNDEKHGANKTEMIPKSDEPVNMPKGSGARNKYLMSISRGNRIQRTVGGVNNVIELDGSTADNDGGNYCRKDAASSQVVNVDTVSISLKELWKHDTRRCVDASPLIAISSTGDTVVFIGSHSYTFCAISMETGRCLWEVTLRDRIESSACLSHCGNFIIVGCYACHVYALCADTGEIWWQYQLNGIIACSPTVDKISGVVYIGSHGQVMYALDVQRRGVMWQNKLCSGAITSPVVCYDPHCVYVATTGQGIVYALCPKTGAIQWKYVCKKFVFSSPTVTQQGVVVGCADNCIYHIGHHGNLLWTFRTNDCIYSIPSVVLRDGPPCKDKKSVDCFKQNSEISYNQSECSNEIRYCCPKLTSATSCKDNSVNRVESDFQTDENASSSFRERHIQQEIKTSNFETARGNLGFCQTLCQETTHESIVVGSNDSCVYCLSSCGCLIWKVKVDSRIYATPFQCEISIDTSDDIIDQSMIKPSTFDENEIFNKKREKCESKREDHVNGGVGMKSNISTNHCAQNCCLVHSSIVLTEESSDEIEEVGEKSNSGEASMTHDNLQNVCEASTKGFTEIVNSIDDMNRNVSKLSVVVFVTVRGVLYILDVRTGQILSQHRLTDGKREEIFSSPVLHENRVVIGCRDNFVYCYEISAKGRVLTK